MSKRILIAICAVIPTFAFADIIATINKGNIEDVTVVSIGANEIVYKKGNAQKTIASSEVDGVLYEDGRYITPPRANTVVESNETTSNDSWAIDDKSEEDKSASSKRRQKREKKERTGNSSEVGQAFKDAGASIKEAFTIMFDAMGKKKEKGTSGSTNTENHSNQESSTASEDGW